MLIPLKPFNPRPVKFSETLARELNQAAPGVRKKLAEALKISASALSQYEKGKISPPLKKLAEIGEYLNITLDYLVFGDVNSNPSVVGDKGTLHPMYEFLEEKIEALHSRTEERNWVLFRVADIIARRIDKLTGRLVNGGAFGYSDIHPGRIDDQECLRLEKHAKLVQIFSTDFTYDLSQAENGTFIPGKFFPVVRDNIIRGCRYQYILPKGKDWSHLINAFHDLLRKEIGDKGKSHCDFRISKRTFISGMGLLQMNIDSFRDKEPMLYSYLSEFSAGEWVAYIIPPSTRVHGDLLISADKIETTKELFMEVWEDADFPSGTKRLNKKS